MTVSGHGEGGQEYIMQNVIARSDSDCYHHTNGRGCAKALPFRLVSSQMMAVVLVCWQLLYVYRKP